MNIPIWSKRSLVTLTTLLAVASAQEEFTLEFLQLDTLDSTPAEVLNSPNYQTLIEFEGMQIGQPSSGRVDLITLEREPDPDGLAINDIGHVAITVAERRQRARVIAHPQSPNWSSTTPSQICAASMATFSLMKAC